MKITIICEGRTELAFKESLREFLKPRLPQRMPKIDIFRCDGAILSGGKLRRAVENLLNAKANPSHAVIGLTDVYPEFTDAADAKQKLRDWVGEQPAFYAHVALHDFEAWLLPYWDRIQKLAGKKAKPLGLNPEGVNHGDPPSRRIKRLFETGACRDSYNKPRDAKRILEGADLQLAIDACPELKSMVNTILGLCDKSKVIA